MDDMNRHRGTVNTNRHRRLGVPAPALAEILQRVWSAAVDACSSPDFRDADGLLNEEAYLRYQRNVFAQAASAIQDSVRPTAARTGKVDDRN